MQKHVLIEGFLLWNLEIFIKKGLLPTIEAFIFLFHPFFATGPIPQPKTKSTPQCTDTKCFRRTKPYFEDVWENLCIMCIC